MKATLMSALGASVLLADVAVLLTGCGASRVSTLLPVVPDGTDGVEGGAVPDTFWLTDPYVVDACGSSGGRLASGESGSLTRGNVWQIVTPSYYGLNSNYAGFASQHAGLDAASAVGDDLAHGSAAMTSRGCARLSRAYPNPLSTRAAIEYGVGLSARVTIRIYTVGGRMVRTLLDRDLPTGAAGRIVWDGRDETGERCAHGVYFCRIQAGGFTDSRKLLLLR